MQFRFTWHFSRHRRASEFAAREIPLFDSSKSLDEDFQRVHCPNAFMKAVTTIQIKMRTFGRVVVALRNRRASWVSKTSGQQEEII